LDGQHIVIIIYIVASVGFMGSLVPEHKKKLAVYPVFLFYLFLAWFSLIV
jgi:hypothetical protein